MQFLIFIAVVLPVALGAAVTKRATPIGEVNRGRAFRAGTSPGTPPGGACAIPGPDVFVPTPNNTATIIARVGNAPADWDNSEICGVCVRICNPRESLCANAIVLEQQGGLPAGSIAIPDFEYGALGFSDGNDAVEWTTQKCAYERPIRLKVDSSTNAGGFVKIRVLESNLPVAGVEIWSSATGPNFLPMTRQSDNAFTRLLPGNPIGSTVGIRIIPRATGVQPITDVLLLQPDRIENVESTPSNF